MFFDNLLVWNVKFNLNLFDLSVSVDPEPDPDQLLERHGQLSRLVNAEARVQQRHLKEKLNVLDFRLSHTV